MRKAAMKGGDGRGRFRVGRSDGATVPGSIDEQAGMAAEAEAVKAAAEASVEPETGLAGVNVPDVDLAPVVEAEALSAELGAAAGGMMAPDDAPEAPAVDVAADSAADLAIESPDTGTGGPTGADLTANTMFASRMADPVDPEPAPTNTGMEKVMKTTEEFFAFGQGNFEAIMKAGQIWATGMQDLSKQMTAGAQANLDETMAAFKAMSSVKTLKDAIDMQTGFARSSFEKSMTETGKLTDASLKLAEQAMAPITARVTTAMDSFVKAA